MCTGAPSDVSRFLRAKSQAELRGGSQEANHVIASIGAVQCDPGSSDMRAEDCPEGGPAEAKDSPRIGSHRRLERHRIYTEYHHYEFYATLCLLSNDQSQDAGESHACQNQIHIEIVTFCRGRRQLCPARPTNRITKML